MRYLAVLLTMACLSYAAVDPLAEAARNKITSIKKDKAAPGSTIVLSSQELNAWARAELGEEDLGVKSPKIVLGPGSLHLEAVADFGKLAGGKNNQDGMLAKMLAGDRTIKMAMRPEAASGKLTVHLDLVEISGVQLTGTLLRLAASLVLAKLSGDIVLDEPFKLGHNVDSASVSPEAVRINIAGPKRALPAPIKPNQNKK
jgi:hypothetical protein